MKPLSIYLAHPISGSTFGEIHQWYTKHIAMLTAIGYRVYDPVTMYTKSTKKDETCASADLKGALINNHALFERDKWMVNKVDIVLAVLTGATRVSIGAVTEIAWGSLLNKHTIVVMEKDNIHRHAFVIEAADVVFENIKEAIDYLKDLNPLLRLF